MSAPDDFLAIVAEVARARAALKDACVQAEDALKARTEAGNRLNEAERRLGARLDEMIGVDCARFPY